MVRTFVQTIASKALCGELGLGMGLGLGLGLGLDVGVALGVKRAYYVIGYIPATSHAPHTHHTGTFLHPDTAAASALNIKIYHSHIKLKKQRVWRDQHSKQFLPATSSLLALYPLRQLSM